ncbi:hypothetical protein [Bacillus sp. FJAT-49736]|uniref:hypothetical protein n=1 Tax=Bacillus sp. FJAT-49736 TaxID=2833582 RepID=UPI001BCA66D4|nr:hypothetical protein [Bacillus sp. FJAT-49736]MBS4174867.1 hypothetical protein [Bacillus sp. FJAT-49736]
MSNTYLIIINLLATIFILYLIFQFFRVRRTRIKCEPVHERSFRVKGTGKWWHTRIYIIVLGLYMVLVLLSLWFFNLRTLLFLYGSTMAGYWLFPTLFRYGKIGKKGVSIADIFIPWEDVEKVKLEWLPLSHSYYPNGELTLMNQSHQNYTILIEKTCEKEICNLLEKNNLVTITT